MSSREYRVGQDPGESQPDQLEELKLFLPADLTRSSQRCSWPLVSETGRTRTEIMAEMARDFLVKHGC
jgi:hypothetical protein